ncbi:MAG: 50S ribosomal protein L6 [Dehalococcoidia bacterium]|nr:50S ribosomal protein L6 [Dehalococcoidia bacterium]
MSRVGKKPINLPPGVEISISGSEVAVKGPKGELHRKVAPEISISLENRTVTVSRPTDSRVHRALHGLTRSILANMVQGVSEGFRKNLELQGVGYRVQKSGTSIAIQIGYTKPVDLNPPPGIGLVSDAPNQISVLGIDKELVGEYAAELRAIRPPDPYLGKGIRYAGERVRRKAGKAGKVGRRK